jgi:hypothetical protein
MPICCYHAGGKGGNSSFLEKNERNWQLGKEPKKKFVPNCMQIPDSTSSNSHVRAVVFFVFSGRTRISQTTNQQVKARQIEKNQNRRVISRLGKQNTNPKRRGNFFFLAGGWLQSSVVVRHMQIFVLQTATRFRTFFRLRRRTEGWQNNSSTKHQQQQKKTGRRNGRRKSFAAPPIIFAFSTN